MVGRNLRRRKGDDEDAKVENVKPAVSSETKPKSKSKNPPAKVYFDDDNDSGSDLSDPPPSPVKPLFPNLTSTSSQPSTSSKTKKGTAKPKPKVPSKPRVKAAPRSTTAGKKDRAQAKVSETPGVDLSAIPSSNTSAALQEKDPNVTALSSHPPVLPVPDLSAIPPASTLLENVSNLPALSHQPQEPQDAPPLRPLSPSEYPFGIPPSPPRQGTPEGSAPTPPYHLSASPEQWAAERLMDIAASSPIATQPVSNIQRSAFDLPLPALQAEGPIIQENNAKLSTGKEKEKNLEVIGEKGLWKPSENNPRCPSCTNAISRGVPREDVKCIGGPPCVECRAKGWGEMECVMGRVMEIGEVVKGRKRGRVD